MRGKLNEIQVGLLTVAAIIVLIVGMLWLKNVDLRRGSRTYLVDFARVEGMREGDKVQVRGIRMGQVANLTIMPQAVRVQVELDETVELREDAVITLGEKGIVGEVVIEIDPGTGAAVSEGHVFQGRTAGSIAAMTDAAGEALDEMQVLTDKVIELIEQVKTDGKVIATLEQANTTLTKVDRMVEQNHADVTVILDNLRATSDGLRELVESGRVHDTFDGASRAAANADSLLATMDEAGRRLNSLLAKLDEGGGSAALLMNDPALYTRTDSTLTAVQRLLDDLRRNPKKYFKLSVIDF